MADVVHAIFDRLECTIPEYVGGWPAKVFGIKQAVKFFTIMAILEACVFHVLRRQVQVPPAALIGALVASLFPAFVIYQIQSDLFFFRANLSLNPGHVALLAWSSKYAKAFKRFIN